MPKSRSIVVLGYLPSLIACFGLSGCEKTERIESYTVPKHESLQTTAYLEDEQRRHHAPIPVPRRMIGVIIRKSSLLWFLKLEGDVDAVAARETDVRQFLKTLRFSQDDMLEWTLPNGWHELPGSELRQATLVLGGQPQLEMSVSKLPLQPDMDLSEQVLMNINRWRNQLSLKPIEQDQLGVEAEKLNINDFVAYWVNLEGSSIPKPSAKAPPQKPAASSKAPPEQEMPQYQLPEGWKKAAPTMYAKVSLQVLDGDAKVAITVTPAGGNRGVNVNRWRGQLNLKELTAEELASSGKTVQVGEGTGDLFEMTNGKRTILGVIAESSDQTWFVKLDGDSQLAERERPHFEAFLKSLQLNDGR